MTFNSMLNIMAESSATSAQRTQPTRPLRPSRPLYIQNGFTGFAVKFID